jgi:hypothetical protein
MPASIVEFTVDLPSGGTLHLQTADEVDLWEKAKSRYEEDYVLQKHNDLVALGVLLQQQVLLFRCQTAINGMEPALDGNGVPTGSYRRVELDGSDLAAYQKGLNEAAKEMSRIEKSLGIDKATREQGGAHTVDNYLKVLKRAANSRGIHITKQVVEYQRVMKELSWKLRMLYHADKQDRAYHNITPKTVLDWLNEEVQRLGEVDKEHAKEFGKLYAGQL